jgi:multiple sugar transport system substrate-binding protein
MSWTRRRFLEAGATALGAATIAGRVQAQAKAAAPALVLKPEKGAQLRVLRWKAFVAGDEKAWNANSEKYTTATGVKVVVDSQSWEEVRPLALAAATEGKGYDIYISTFEDAHRYPDKLVQVNDVAEYLGAKYGGWYHAAQAYCRHQAKSGPNPWVAIPMGATGWCLVFRQSHIEAAGFARIPDNLDDFLKLCRGLQAKGTPAGFALGNATGDANSWTHWVLWAHNAKLVDARNNITIDSKETLAALEYAKELYQTFIPGTLGWRDPENNRAFLEGKISLTSNAISVYYAARSSREPRLEAMAGDIGHANMPVGRTRRPTELNMPFPMMIFRHTKYPEAAKDYLRFMMEREQYVPWQQAALGYVTQPLRAYESNPLWNSDPKVTPFRDAMKVMLPNGYAGEIGAASATAMAEFVVVNMFADAVSGAMTPREAMQRATTRAQRIYGSARMKGA